MSGNCDILWNDGGSILWNDGGAILWADCVPEPEASPATPGFISHMGRYPRLESEAEKLARRIREGTLPAPIVAVTVSKDSGDDKKYVKESLRLSTAIARLRGDASASKAEIERLEAAQRERESEIVARKLMLERQALILAQQQEAALIDEMTLMDITYVAAMAYAIVTQ